MEGQIEQGNFEKFNNSKFYSGMDIEPRNIYGENDDTSDDKRYPEYCQTMTVTDSHGVVKELVFPKALDLDRPKRARTTFSNEQLFHLEREFHRNQYLVGRERTELARTLGLSETQVKVWFQNRRTKYKRDRLKDAEVQKANSESLAACNILRMLQHVSPPSGQTTKPQASRPLVAPPGSERTTTSPPQGVSLGLPLMGQASCQTTQHVPDMMTRNCQTTTAHVANSPLMSPVCHTTTCTPQGPFPLVAPSSCQTTPHLSLPPHPALQKTVSQASMAVHEPSRHVSGQISSQIPLPMFATVQRPSIPHMPLTAIGLPMPLLHR